MVHLKEFVPPILWRVASSLRDYGTFRKAPQFSGVVRTRADLPEVGLNPFDTDAWIEVQRRNGVRGVAANSHSAALLVLCGLCGDEIEIFDVGAGPGVLLPTAKASGKPIRYVAVESPKLAELGSRLHPDAHFFSDPAEAVAALAKPDIAICVGTLQYIEDWRNALRTLTAKQPTFVMIGRHSTPPDGAILYAVQRIDTAAGKCGSTYITFIPKASLVEAMEEMGYRLIADLPLDDATGEVAPNDRKTVPRLQTRNFIFRRA